jgi:hypothetical protein
MEAILETKTEAILQFLGGILGSLHVTFEEGTWAAWLHDLLKPHVTQVLVCDTWAGQHSEPVRSFQSPGRYFS